MIQSINQSIPVIVKLSHFKFNFPGTCSLDEKNNIMFWFKYSLLLLFTCLLLCHTIITPGTFCVPPEAEVTQVKKPCRKEIEKEERGKRKRKMFFGIIHEMIFLGLCLGLASFHLFLPPGFRALTIELERKMTEKIEKWRTLCRFVEVLCIWLSHRVYVTSLFYFLFLEFFFHFFICLASTWLLDYAKQSLKS